jgi:hypothetical protein
VGDLVVAFWADHADAASGHGLLVVVRLVQEHHQRQRGRSGPSRLARIPAEQW